MQEHPPETGTDADTAAVRAPDSAPVPASSASRLHIVVSGQVQGVFFRAGTVNEAKKLGLLGWVRNNTDGSVEIVAEGARSQLEKLLEWCVHGPEGADVSDIEYDWGDASTGTDSGGFVDFRVR